MQLTIQPTALGDFVVTLLKIVLDIQVVLHADQYLKATCIATGLPSGVLLAILYLSEADNIVHARFGARSDFRFFYRYVDDSMICGSKTVVDQVLSTLSSWSYLAWEVTGFDTTTVFLDRVLSIQHGNIISDLHVKPQSRRFQSLIVGGVTRIVRACPLGVHRIRHLESFQTDTSRQGT